MDNFDYNEQNPGSYQQQQYNNYYAPPEQYNTYQPTIGDWVKTLLLMAIPFAGFIITIIFAIGSNDPTKQYRTNFARGYFIFGAIVCVLVFLFYILLFAFALAVYSSHYSF